MAFSFGKMNDADATLFVQVSGITDTTQRGAIVDLVKDLKSNNLWSKMKAIYPFVGGTATTHKFNLKDPRDADAAFRLTFSGGWTHSSTGALPNGSTGYADTYLVPATNTINNSFHMSYYSRTADAGNESEIGAYIAASSSLIQLIVRYTAGAGTNLCQSVIYSTTNVAGSTNTDGRGFFIGTRTNSTTNKIIKNTTILATDTTTSAGFSNHTYNLYLGGRNDAGTLAVASKKQCAFATIGDGLTDSDAANLYTIVQKYQTTLGRQV
jgi:hypothetical protein